MDVRELAVEIPVGGGAKCGGLLFEPAADGPWPGVVQLTDIFGIREAANGMAKRLAEKGFAVLEPNIFYRTGAPPLFDFPPKIGEERTMNRLGELRAPLTPEAMEADAVAYAKFLAGQRGVKQGGLGIVGYCLTGSMAVRAAAALPEKIAAAASFHGGGLATDAPTSPHALLPRVKARLYFGHAVNDKSMPQESIEKLDAALRAWGGRFESEVYAGALHGWTVPDSAAYNGPQAERAFEKLAGLFRESLG